MGSSIARESHVGAYTHAGPEIGVASTKAFTAQVTIFIFSLEKKAQYLIEIRTIANAQSNHIASVYKDVPNCLFLGRGITLSVLEGAKSRGISSSGDEARTDWKLSQSTKRWSVTFRKLQEKEKSLLL